MPLCDIRARVLVAESCQIKQDSRLDEACSVPDHRRSETKHAKEDQPVELRCLRYLRRSPSSPDRHFHVRVSIDRALVVSCLSVQHQTEPRIVRVQRSEPRFTKRAIFGTQRRGTAVAPRGYMSRIRKKENGTPQNAGDTMVADIDRDLVSQRAYERYVERGREDGQDLDDWLTAERELRERRNPLHQEN